MLCLLHAQSKAAWGMATGQMRQTLVIAQRLQLTRNPCPCCCCLASLMQNPLQQQQPIMAPTPLTTSSSSTPGTHTSAL